VIWGIDLGVRSFYAAGLEHGELTLISRVILAPKSVRAQSAADRASELTDLYQALHDIITLGDTVVVEEPPMAGARNVRTFLKLGQVCGVVIAAASAKGADVHLVPVDTWKKEIVGKGGAPKEIVASALSVLSSRYSAQCEGNQNSVDATCIALFGRTLTGGVGPEYMDAGRASAGQQRRSA